MSFIESKLRGASPNTSPSMGNKTHKRSTSDIKSSSSQEHHPKSTEARNLKGETVDETVINAFVRKSAVTGIKKLVSEGQILQVSASLLFCHLIE